jgi:hypothetical protein
MSLSKRQLAEIRRKTRAELLEAGVIDLKDILSKEDIRLMESIKFDARHIVSKINGVTLLSEFKKDRFADTNDFIPSASGGQPPSNTSSDRDGSGDSNGPEESKNKPEPADKEKVENYISDLFVKYAGKILLFILKLLRKLAGAEATALSAIATFGFKKTIISVLKHFGLSDESAKSAEEFFSKLVYHFVDLFGGGKPLDVVISTLENEKPEDVSKIAVNASKMAKEEMKKSKEKSKETEIPAAETSAAKTESLTRLNKDIMILERRFRNQKRAR